MSSDSQPQKKKIYLLIVPLMAIVLIGALAIGFWLGNRFSSNPKQNVNGNNQLTIASFKSEVIADDPQVLAYLDLEIQNYWVENNTVRCTGQVEWHTADYTLDGLAICMYIRENQTKYKSVDVKVVAHGGLLLLPTGTIDSDSIQVPKLGEDLFKFDFSLTCTYQ
jgi:hypothetical protein